MTSAIAIAELIIVLIFLFNNCVDVAGEEIIAPERAPMMWTIREETVPPSRAEEKDVEAVKVNPVVRRRARRDLAAPQIKDLIVEEHNKYRKSEGATDMIELKYNDYLADMADEWSKRCDFNHGHPTRSDQPWLWIGQNLYAVSSTKVNYTRAILSWFSEKKYFEYDLVLCSQGRLCGHYTQVVWHETTDVGCASSICPTLSGTPYTNAVFIVCNYGPGGNYLGEQPFGKGEACAACPNGTICRNGLCSLLEKSENATASSETATTLETNRMGNVPKSTNRTEFNPETNASVNVTTPATTKDNSTTVHSENITGLITNSATVQSENITGLITNSTTIQSENITGLINNSVTVQSENITGLINNSAMVQSENITGLN